MRRSVQLVLSVLCVALLGVATNIATGVMPSSWSPYLWLSWPAFAVLVIVVIVLEAVDPRRRSEPDSRNPVMARRILIGRVRRYWVHGVLEKSLYHEARIELKLTAIVKGRNHPWDLMVAQPNGQAVDFPPGTRMNEIFDAMDRTVVILGEPGSGKTTMLLELARDLLEQAEADESNPVPVVLPLASWANRQQAMNEWVIEQLAVQYGIPKQLAATWVKDQVIVPLFDGLDEVPEEHREACASAINNFHLHYTLTGTALCCRSTEYGRLIRPVAYYGAVTIRPLARIEVAQYLDSAGRKLEALRGALSDDPGLWELAESPLMLSIMMLAYQETLGHAVTKPLPTRRENLFAKYVRTMLYRRVNPLYPPPRAARYLAVMAANMNSRSQTVFTLDSLNSLWTGGTHARRWLDTDRWARPVCVLAAALVFASAVWAISIWWVGVLLGLLAGVVVWVGFRLPTYDELLDISFGIVMTTQNATLSHVRSARLGDWMWNWTSGVLEQIVDVIRDHLWWLVLIIVSAAGAGAAIGASRGVWAAVIHALALTTGMLVAVPVVSEAIFNVDQVRRRPSISNRELPSPALRLRLGFAIKVGLGISIICGLLGGILALLAPTPVLPPIRFGTVIALLAAAYAIILIAGGPLVEQLILRWRLRDDDLVPVPYLPFLDFMVQCLVLRAVGPGYIFVHRELMDFLAAQTGHGKNVAAILTDVD